MTSEPDDLPTLLEMYVDDRDSLSETQYEHLVEAMRESPAERAKLKDQLILEEKLGQMMASDRADFPAQVEQRIRDLDLTTDDLQRQVQEMRALAGEQYPARPHKRSRSGWVLAACLLLAVGAGAFYVIPGLNDRPQVIRVYGSSTLIRNNAKTPLVAGERLSYGDRILTQSAAYVVLSYPDGTHVSVAGQTLIRLSSRYRSGKIIDVDRGAVASTVTAQPAGRPMRFLTPRADAKVVGTELMLEVTGQETRLNVAHGKVELRGLSSQRAVLVRQHEFGVSQGGDATVSELSWPSSRERLETMLAPGGDAVPTDWELRGETLWDDGLQFRRGSAVLPVADAQAVTSACRASNELSLELVFRFGSTRQSGPARMVSLSSDVFTRNFTLGQEGGYLVFRLRTPETGENGTNPEIRLCRITDRKLHHVIITYRDGLLNCYLDGERVSQTTQIRGDFSNWTDHYLTLGDEWGGDGDHVWRGQIRALAVYSRALTAQQALRNMTAMPRT